MVTVRAIHRLPLSQKRFKSGAIYVSCICSGAKIDALDVRYFVETDEYVIPTKQGFRIPADRLVGLRQTLELNAPSSEGIELWSGTERRLLIRSCNDEYGEGVDVRYHSDSDRYRGWEPRGIRFRPDDFSKLKEALLSSTIWKGTTEGTSNLFDGRAIRSRERGAAEQQAVAGGHSTKSRPRDPAINEALLDFIEGR